MGCICSPALGQPGLHEDLNPKINQLNESPHSIGFSFQEVKTVKVRGPSKDIWFEVILHVTTDSQDKHADKTEIAELALMAVIVPFRKSKRFEVFDLSPEPSSPSYSEEL